jgi:hypothetical protein
LLSPGHKIVRLGLGKSCVFDEQIRQMPCISRRKYDAGRAAGIWLQFWKFDYDLLGVFSPPYFQKPRYFVHFRLLRRAKRASDTAP